MSKHVPVSYHTQPHPLQPATVAPASVSDPLRSMYAAPTPAHAASQTAHTASANTYRQTWQHLHNLPLQINAPFIVARSNTPTPTIYHANARWPSSAPPASLYAPAFVHSPQGWPSASHGVATVNLAQVHPTDAAYDRSRLLAPLPLRTLAASPSPGLPSSWGSSSHSVSAAPFSFGTPLGSDNGSAIQVHGSASVSAPRRSKHLHERMSDGASDEPGSDDSDEIFGSDPPSSEAQACQTQEEAPQVVTRRVTRSSLGKAARITPSAPSSDDTDSQSTTSDPASSGVDQVRTSARKVSTVSQASNSLFPRGKALSRLDELATLSPPTPTSRDARHPFKARHQTTHAAGDWYTPRWVRGGRTGEGAKADIGSKEGWCGMCVLEGNDKAGTWHNLRNSSYRYHMTRMHGVSSKTNTFVADPLRIARTKKTSENKLHGECAECNKTIVFSASFPPTSWFVHAAGCHAVSKEGAQPSEADASVDAPAVTTRHGKRAATTPQKALRPAKLQTGARRSRAASIGKSSFVIPSKPSATGVSAKKDRRSMPSSISSVNVRKSSINTRRSSTNTKASSSAFLAGNKSNTAASLLQPTNASSSSSTSAAESDDETDVETDVEMAQLLLSFSAPGSSATVSTSAPLLSVPPTTCGPRRAAFETKIIVTSPEPSPARTCEERSASNGSEEENKENLPPMYAFAS